MSWHTAVSGHKTPSRAHLLDIELLLVARVRIDAELGDIRSDVGQRGAHRVEEVDARKLARQPLLQLQRRASVMLAAAETVHR